MLRIALLGALLYFSSSVFGADGGSVATTDKPVEEEAVVHRHSLAAHLGLTADEAIFRAPRTMRSRGLDNLSLDGDAEPAPVPTTH